LRPELCSQISVNEHLDDDDEYDDDDKSQPIPINAALLMNMKAKFETNVKYK